MVEEINDTKFKDVINNKKVLVDCYATWCGPCRMLAPIIEEIAKEREDYKVYKLDVDESMAVTKEYGIMSIPTILIFEEVILKEKIVGFMPKDELVKKL